MKLFEHITGLFSSLEGSATKKTFVPHKEIQPGQTGASAALLAELDKPPGERSLEKIANINSAITTANEMQYKVEQAGKKVGIKSNRLRAEPLVDEQGNIVGFKVD